jgi:site-specific DNA recombinase
LNKRAAETELRLKRLYDAIEAGVADLHDPALKERVASLKAIRDQAQADAARAAAMLDASAQQVITPQMVHRFALTARERIRIDGGATAATISARSPSASRWLNARSASSARRRICFRR